MHIVIVDDHEEIRTLLSRYLSEKGFHVTTAEDAQMMRRLLLKNTPDLIVLDIMMPGEDGLSLCRYLRENTSIPVILLTAVSTDIDRIVGLEMGADDYVTKPFNTRELLARIKAVLRRANNLPPKQQRPKAQQLRFGPWILDVSKRELLNEGGLATPLSSAEYRLLMVLLDHPQIVLTRDQLLDLTVGRDSDVFDRSIDNQVSRLRKKIEADPRNPELIKTHWGGGYCLTVEVRTV
ncbi:response regulator [Pseudomonas aeruginosa]|uniref:response regulator n=1 Tax=Pseudomonas aeruginosa TaxID=287 RepID=UPI0004D93CBD|nr:response regulator [Pseudomonas aeruginosa]EKN9356296.1 response regulator [Pseudomonas aeruginosa]ELK4905665.1 response regulator [Pseudomonas aeruginosa]KEA42847.1 chemotaxis protein CheY [Pseudomonas aeruginosa]KSG75184.1 DNA-binding response regulator [Pseudomonas aeruginosa]KSJ42477.1 DNA-binding response regulator [Pseudomonas aeruginosa]